jgi:hypothetical protein
MIFHFFFLIFPKVIIEICRGYLVLHFISRASKHLLLMRLSLKTVLVVLKVVVVLFMNDCENAKKNLLKCLLSFVNC